MRIAMLGTRGVPANYGGFETCVEEVGARLASAGHEVTVYCRSSYFKTRLETHKGMQLVYLPSVRKKSLDTMTHTALSALHACGCGYDAILVFNAANAPFLLPLRLLGKRMAVNTDGLEWKRAKWGRMGKLFYRISEKVACIMANRLVSDSEGIRDYYAETHGADSSVIAYGAYPCENPPTDLLAGFGLAPRGYFLQITRFEPENHPLETIRAFNTLTTDKKLVLVGGSPYDSDYVRAMRAEAGPNVILPGFLYEKAALDQLWGHCHAYVHGNSVGGTNPALLQTMASGCFTMAADVPFNHDVLADTGVYFERSADALAEKMAWSLAHEDELGDYRRKALARVKSLYDWDVVAGQYETLCRELMDGQHPWRPVISSLFRWSIPSRWLF